MQKICRSCGIDFEIAEDDLEFYAKISPTFGGKKLTIPPPTLCPECRLQRRLSFRCPIFVFRRTGYPDGAPIFSMFPEDTPFPVMLNEYWHGNEWDSEQFAEEISWNTPFFEQFQKFISRVPQPALASVRNENCDYCNNLSDNKNCYLVFNTSNAEDCMYCDNSWDSKDCIECTMTMQSELCYDTTFCVRSYQLQSSEYCQDCTDSHFLSFCRSCRHCFGCVNLRHKKYCIWNEQRTKEEYEAFIKEFRSESWAERERYKTKLQELSFQQPRPHAIFRQTENVSGNFIQEAKNVHDSIYMQHAEDCTRCFNLHEHVKDCRDYSLFGRRAEMIYECASCGIDIQSLAFCYQCREGSNSLYYCCSCDGCSNCFACISLRKKSYCIFNKQYTKEDYERLVPKLIEKMRFEGAWGELFPMTMSVLHYNLSLAQRYFPLTKSDALARGLRWYDKETEYTTVIDASKLPDELPAKNESFVVSSAFSGRPFRVTSREIELYRTFKVPLPRHTYDERMEERIKKLGGIRLHKRECMKSGKNILTTYPPDSPYIIWDRDEYEKEYSG